MEMEKMIMKGNLLNCPDKDECKEWIVGSRVYSGTYLYKGSYDTKEEAKKAVPKDGIVLHK